MTSINSKSTINIAQDFSQFPAGRSRSDGPNSAERFRDQHLIPALSRFEHVTVVMDGTAGYGSSFLEEAFGGLIRAGQEEYELKAKLTLVSEDPFLIEEINQYITDAGARQGK